MADNVASGQVFHGQTGTGTAQVLGAPVSPLSVLRENRSKQQAVDAARAKERAAAKEERDKAIKEWMAQDPEQTFQPFNEQVANAYRNIVLEQGMEDLAQGIDPSSSVFMARNKVRMQKVNEIARAGNYIKGLIADKRKEVEENKYIFKDKAYSKINDLYLTEDGKGRPHDQINYGDFETVLKDPELFNMKAFAKDFVSNLEENVIKYKVQKNKGIYGDDGFIETDIKELKSKLFQIDPVTNKPLEDPDGNPIINVTPELVNSFLSDPYAAAAVLAEAEKTGKSIQEVIKAKVSPFAYAKEQLDKTSLTKYNVDSGTANKQKFMTERLQAINNIQNAFYDENGNRVDEPIDAAQVALGRIKKNTKIGNAPVIDAAIIPAGARYDEETMSVTEEGAGAPREYDRVVFKVRAGTIGGDPTYAFREVDLTNPGAGAELNAIFQTSKNELDLPWQTQMEFNEKTGGQLYKAREKNEVVTTEEEKAQVQKWQKGKDLKSLSGKTTSDGKVIKSVKFNEGAPWPAPAEKRKPFLDVVYEDGTAENIDPKNSEYFMGVMKASNEFTPEINAGISAFMKANKLSRDEAIKILKDNGKI